MTKKSMMKCTVTDTVPNGTKFVAIYYDGSEAGLLKFQTLV